MVLCVRDLHGILRCGPVVPRDRDRVRLPVSRYRPAGADDASAAHSSSHARSDTSSDTSSDRGTDTCANCCSDARANACPDNDGRFYYSCSNGSTNTSSDSSPGADHDNARTHHGGSNCWSNRGSFSGTDSRSDRCADTAAAAHHYHRGSARNSNKCCLRHESQWRRSVKQLDCWRV